MMRGFLSTALSWTLIACGFGLPVEAQDERAGVFGEVIDVRVVNLEVVVTEKGGRVTGLRPDDFILTVDGKEVSVEYFTEVLGGRAVLRGHESEALSVPTLAPGEVVGTSYLLFLDDYFSVPKHRDRLIDKLIAQLPLLNLEDRMAIVAYDGKRVEMLSTWSQSVTSLTRVLEKAKEREAYGLQRRDETRTFDFTRVVIERDEALLPEGFAGGQVTAGDGSFEQLAIDERHQIALITKQVRGAVLAASATLRSFAGPPGRRVFMLASGGWPNSPAISIVGDRKLARFRSEFEWGERLYGPLIETANRLSYTIYPIDVPGSFSLSETTGAGTAGISAPRGLLTDKAVAELAKRRQRQLIDRNQEEDVALDFIARKTGGRSFLNAASLKAFERIVEDTRTYYWIGFTPNWQGDDAEHRVVVKARRRGLDMRSRQSFSDLSRQTEVSMMVESSLLFGGPPSATPLVAIFGTPGRAGFGKVIMPLRIQVPVAELTFLPVQDGLRAEIELRVAVIDEQGKTADIPVMPISLQASVPPRQGQSKAFHTTIKMRKRKHDVVVSLYDQLSGKIISTKMEVDLRDVDPRKRGKGSPEIPLSRRGGDLEVGEAYWQILLDWAEGSDTAPADLLEWQQSVIDSLAGVEITASTFGTLPYRASADGGIGETIVPGLPCLKTVTKYTIERLDLEALLPLADLYRRTFQEQLGPPTRFWLKTLNQDAFELLVELYELDRVDSPLSRRRVVLAWMAMADLLASAGYNEMGERALEIYLHVSKLDPDNQVARYWVAYLDEQYGHYGKAAKHLWRLAAARPDDAEARLRLAVNLIRTGRKRAASPLLEGIAGGEDPDWMRIVAFQELGRLYAETEVAKAQSYLESGHRIFPLNARIALQLSHLQQTARHRAIALAYEAEAAWSGDPGVSPRKRYELPRVDGILEVRQDFQSEVTSLRPALGKEMRSLRKVVDLPHFAECDGARP